MLYLYIYDFKLFNSKFLRNLITRSKISELLIEGISCTDSKWRKEGNKSKKPKQHLKKKKKETEWGSRGRFAWAPSPHRGSGLQTSLLQDLCFLSTSRCRNTSLSPSRDGTDSSAAPPLRLSTRTGLLLLYAGHPAQHFFLG